MSERLSKVITEDVRPSSKRWTTHPQLFPQSVIDSSVVEAARQGCQRGFDSHSITSYSPIV